MSDQILTAGQVEELLERNEGDDTLRLIRRFAGSHEALRAEWFKSNRAIAELERERDALTAENAALKAGINAELGGGHSLPDLWTAERQLPFVAKALTAARAENAALREERDALKADLETAAHVNQQLNECGLEIQAERDALKAELAALREDRDAWRSEAYDWSKREGQCCPEDVCFEDVIARLERELAEARAEIARLHELLVRSRLDEGAAMSENTLAWLKEEALRRGYRIEVSVDGREERIIRSDGTVVLVAKKDATLTAGVDETWPTK